MKHFHDNDGAAIYVARESGDRAQSRNVSIGHLPQHISKSLWFVHG